MVPADPHTESQATAGQKINIGCLPSDERCLALREDENPGGELDSLSDPGQIGEHHEGIVERVLLGIRAGQLTCSIGVDRAEHMVVRQKMVKAQFLNRSPDPPNSSRISSKLSLGAHNANLHRIQPS
jgi:hypothetical protein